MATVNRYKPNVDYTLAEQVDDGGKVAFIPSVNVASGTIDSDVTVVGPLGSSSAATSVSVTDSTEDVARIGIVTETAPATDTASSGLNGRLQRIAQRLTSLIALIPATPGAAYTDRSIANLSGGSEQLMATNAARRILVVYNIGATSVGVNLTGGTASLTAAGSVVLPAGQSLVLDNAPPTSAITIIGTLNADVTAYEG